MHGEQNKETINDWLKICAGSGSESGLECVDGSSGFAYTYTDKDNGTVLQNGVCMPSPCALGCSFDRQLAYQVGRAVGSLALDYGKTTGGQHSTAVFSPDVGVVRSPLYGRLADRFGEDPYLCGTLGSEWIKGAQSVGTAAILSHFAEGSQQSGKYTCDHMIDARALHEIYLRPFEMTVKLASPRAVYCGLSKLNGLYNPENFVLLTEMLRRKWKFNGTVLADMRLTDPVEAMADGVDLSWPKGSAQIRRSIRQAVMTDELPRYYPAQSAGRIRQLAKPSQTEEDDLLTEDECRVIARKAAERSAVLLKNHKHTLPLPLSSTVALIGRLAKYPRIQRGGVNELPVNAEQLKNMLDVFDDNQVHYHYCDGYNEHNMTDDELLRDAVKYASQSEFAVVFVGFDDYYDNATADRFTNQLPKAQTKLINAVARANANTVVVVNGSALPRMNWIGKVKSVLYLPLGGEEVCTALFRLLFGYCNPSGKLTVSYSLNEGDIACGDTFGRNERISEHRESIYVGYRYFNKANIFAAFPFGYGLSYTKFEYSKMRAVRAPEGWRISLDVKNVGKRDGAEVVQLYIEAPKSDKFRPVRVLEQFEKVFLAKGEKRSVVMILSDEAFQRFDPQRGRFITVGGRYRVCAAASSSDMRTEVWIALSGERVPDSHVPDWYTRPAGRPKESDFRSLFGEATSEPAACLAKPYSAENTLSELSGIGFFRHAVKWIRTITEWRLRPGDRRDPLYAEPLDFILNIPLDRLSGVCRGFFPMKLTGLAIRLANRRGGNGN